METAVALTWHINPATGGMSRCGTQGTSCSFARELHFSSLAEVKEALPEVMRLKREREEAQVSLGDVLEMSDPEKARDLQALDKELKQVKNSYFSLNRALQKEAKESPASQASPQWLARVLKRKSLYYRMLALEARRITFLPEEAAQAARQAKEDALNSEKERNNVWFEGIKANGSFKIHPSMDTPATRRDAIRAVARFSGYSEESLEEDVARLEEDGMSATEAIRQLWALASPRTDKPLLSLDLEVAAPLVRGRVDNGPYSTIIEVGWIKRYPDGTCESKSYLCGVPEDFLYAEGTGAQHIHNITPEMVKGRPLLQDDQGRLQEILRELQECILVAHSAKFELGQLKHNIPGVAALIQEGKLEVLDTRDVCRFFVPETEDNTNRSFVEAAGGTYGAGAHRAYQDALMTLNALLAFKGHTPVEVR